jgi:hypothetical protein
VAGFFARDYHGSMPQTGHALQNLLKMIEEQLADVEVRLMNPVSEDESSRLLSKAADLHLQLEEIRAILNEASRG